MSMAGNSRFRLCSESRRKLDRDIDRDVARGKDAGVEQPAGLGATAATQVDQRESRRPATLPNGGQVFVENRRFGARRVVLGQLGNRLEQARAERVVEELGCDGGLRLQQAGGEFLAQEGILARRIPVEDLQQFDRGSHLSRPAGGKPWGACPDRAA
jgi:hypothetical protein